MINSISSLANMELMLYGGASGFNANCPSFTNGYRATSNMYSNPYLNPYMLGYNTGFYPNQYQATQNNSIFNQGLTAPTQGQYNVTSQSGANDLKILEDFYKQVNSMRQEWSGLPMAAGMIGFTECAQNMKHFWNSGKAIGVTNKVFDMSNSTIKALKLFILYYNGSPLMRLDMLNRVQKIFDGDMYLEELLDYYGINAKVEKDIVKHLTR